MATWRTIAGTETDPEAPITSALMKALADNPIAIAEGEAGAPRILDGALSSTVTGAGQTWVGARLTASNVGTAAGGIGLAGVGSYAMLATDATNVALTAGTTYAGSALRYAGGRTASTVLAAGANVGVGTWRCMGDAGAAAGERSVCVFLRVA